MTDLFLSYASEDRARIAPLVAALEAEGWSVWWDRDLVAGPNFADSIQQALDSASCVVVAWSRHALQSSWVRDEAQEGQERQCLVPCCIDDVRPPLGFRSLQMVSLVGWPEQREGLTGLVAGVRAALAATSSGIPRPEPLLSAGSDSWPFSSHGAEQSIAVLPFTNLSSDAEQQYFCDGLVEDITTELSYIRSLLVISRNSSFSYRSAAPDVGKVARDLRVNFVLLGSVRRSGGRMRVSARLVDGRTEETVWSQRYDRDDLDLFELQDELTSHIVTALDIELISGAKGRRAQKYRRAEARELLYRGLFEFRKFERGSGIEARRYFQQLIDVEPNAVEGYSGLVMTNAFAIMVGWETPQSALPKLRDCVHRCLELDPDDGQALTGDGIYKVLAGDLDGANASLARAVDVEPNLDDAWFVRGWCLMFLGDSSAAIQSLERAMRLSPIPNSIRFGVLGTALRNAGRFEEAVAVLTECLRRFPGFVYAHTSLAIAYGMMGEQAAAEREVRETLKAIPDYTVQRFVNPDFYRSSEVMQRCAEVLRSAGMPER